MQKFVIFVKKNEDKHSKGKTHHKVWSHCHYTEE